MLCREFQRKENASLLTLIKGRWGNRLVISKKSHHSSIVVKPTGDNYFENMLWLGHANIACSHQDASQSVGKLVITPSTRRLQVTLRQYKDRSASPV